MVEFHEWLANIVIYLTAIDYTIRFVKWLVKKLQPKMQKSLKKKRKTKRKK